VLHQVVFIRRDYMFRLKLAIIKSISDIVSSLKRIEYDIFTVDVNILNTSYSVHLELEEVGNLHHYG